jgi:DNA-binding transcriptional LysR family regulator
MIKEPFTDLEKIEKSLQNSANFTKKTVHIGATAISLSVYLFKYLDELKSKFPHITFRIYTDSSANLLKLVEKKVVDFAFVTTPFKLNNDIEAINVYELDNVLVAPVNYKEKLKGEVSLKNISKLPFVLLSNEMQFREHLNEYFRKNDVDINPVYEPDSSSILLQFVENNCGLTFIPKDMAIAAAQENKCIIVDLKEKVPLRYVSFVFNTKYHHSSIVHSIHEEILAKHGSM